MEKIVAALEVRPEVWPRKKPFRITNYVFSESKVLTVRIRSADASGWGEASGVFYRHETLDSMQQQIAAIAPEIEQGADREALQSLLPPGGARNALDCALWDLEAKLQGKPVWALAGLSSPPKPLLTTLTVGADTPQAMAEGAKSYAAARAIKIKLTPEDPAACVRAVRAARPDVWLGVDANQGFTRALLENLIPVFREAGVGLIEQPLAVGNDAELEGLQCSIPIAADESLQSLADVERLSLYYDTLNIKLDKCGGLTEALAIAREARKHGLKVMVGCMSGTSLAMAPAFLVGQSCDFVDLDAPVFLARDREVPVQYEDGKVFCPEALWGGAT